MLRMSKMLVVASFFTGTEDSLDQRHVQFLSVIIE